MNGSSKSSSLFDEIFRLQNAAPDVDTDPEDQEVGFKASLADDSRVESEALGSTALRKRAAIISSDPKYKGKKTSRKDLYSDDDFSDVDLNTSYGLASSEEGDSGKEESADYEEESDDDNEKDEEESDSNEEEQIEDESDEDEQMEVSQDAENNGTVVVPSTKSDDREKGKVVHHQMGVWDDLIKSRIALQKVVLSCNRLPQPDTWPSFANVGTFRKEASNVHSSVRKLVSALLELQLLLNTGDNATLKDNGADSDGEITSESEGEEDAGKTAAKKPKQQEEDDDDEMDEDEEVDDEEDDQEEGGMKIEKTKQNDQKSNKLKRKLDVEEVEETLAKRHTDFQKFRNDTLSKWDEKTRLIHGKIRSKNFAAFEMSVLKQIEQVLVNRERLVKRIHQQRSVSRVLGRPEEEQDNGEEKEEAVEDDEEEVEIKQRQKSEAPVDNEIIDDSDFYHVCLRDLLETRQSEELDPVTASKQRLEIQRLRNKQKKKVDTKASKGRKIRYHVKEKLKNYMTPYDKSAWSDEQKDDLFKAIFGGSQKIQEPGNGAEKPTINIGL